MKTNLNKINNNQIKAVIELDKEDLGKYVAKSEQLLGGELSIKGFRKGKVPKDLIKQNLNKDQVRELALEIAVEESISDVIKENSIDILETSNLSIISNDPAKLEFSILLDIFPDIRLTDLNKIKIKKRAIIVEDQEIEDAAEVIRNSRSVFTAKESDEPTESGDRVEIDFEVKHDNKIIDGGVSKNHPLIIGGKNFIPGFEEQLVGMKRGENKSFSLMAPADYFHKEVAGKKLDFEVKLNDIKQVSKPDFDDNFAKSLGQFTGLVELKQNIKEGLIQEKEIKEKQKLRLEALDAIIANSKIEVPQKLVDGQLSAMVADFDQTLHERGLELGLYLARIGKTEDDLKNDWKKEAEKQTKISLILRRIIKDLNIKASPEEIDEAFNQVVQSAVASGKDNLEGLDPVKMKENISARIVNERAFEYIESSCII